MDGEVEQMLDNNATGTVAINGRNYSPVKRQPHMMPDRSSSPHNSNPCVRIGRLLYLFLRLAKQTIFRSRMQQILQEYQAMVHQVTFWPIFMGTMIFQTAVQFRSLWKILGMLIIGYMDPV